MGTGGIAKPYKEYVEANLIIPGLPQYNEDVLCMVILDNKYQERVPVQIGTLVIDHLVMTITVDELQQPVDTWKQVHLSTVISKRNTVKSLNVPKYNFKEVKGRVYNKRSCNSTSPKHCGEGSCKIDDTFKMCECGLQSKHRVFGPHCHGQIFRHPETKSMQMKCLSKKSQCKANQSP